MVGPGGSTQETLTTWMQLEPSLRAAHPGGSLDAFSLVCPTGGTALGLIAPLTHPQPITRILALVGGATALLRTRSFPFPPPSSPAPNPDPHWPPHLESPKGLHVNLFPV